MRIGERINYCDYLFSIKRNSDNDVMACNIAFHEYKKRREFFFYEKKEEKEITDEVDENHVTRATAFIDSRGMTLHENEH